MEKEILEQEQASRLIEKHILNKLNLIAEKELKENPELLMEAKNYYPVNENGKRDDDNGEYPEIFEYWAVSDWLMDKLEAKGEVVFKMLNFNVWGRQGTGQAIKLDNVIQEIAKKSGF